MAYRAPRRAIVSTLVGVSLSTCLSRMHDLRLQDLLKEAAIELHRPPQLLSGCFTNAAPLRDIMSEPVVGDQLRLIHRNVGRALPEIAHWISSGRQGLCDQRVPARNRSRGIIHKLFLDQPPLTRELIAFRRRQVPDAKSTHSLFSGFQDL